MLQTLQSPHFWIGYGTVSVLLVGVFFCVIGFHRWYKDWHDYDFPRGLIRVLASLFFSLIFPITLVFYASMLISMAITRAVEKKRKAEVAKVVPKQQVRCYQCAQLIGLSDSFCSLCGADQTKTKKD